VLQATAIVQQTKTALEVQRQQAAIAAEQTRTALQAKATQAAIEATRVAAEARDRDNRAVATSVAISIQATQQAQTALASDIQRRQDVTFGVFAVVMIMVGLGALYLVALLIRRASRAITKPAMATAPLSPMPAASSAAALMVIDSATGRASPRMPDVEEDDSLSTHQYLRNLFGYEDDEHGHQP
jgi:hypothetical protein